MAEAAFARLWPAVRLVPLLPLLSGTVKGARVMIRVGDSPLVWFLLSSLPDGPDVYMELNHAERRFYPIE
jgi:hypothetical protein